MNVNITGIYDNTVIVDSNLFDDVRYNNNNNNNTNTNTHNNTHNNNVLRHVVGS